MALAPKKLIRQADGSLVETTAVGPAIEGSSSELGQPPPPEAPPLTPAGAAGAGAGPDSAKMHGTKAQKQNALAQTVAASADQTLQSRQVGAPTQPPAEATETAARAQQLAGSLSTLGSYGARVQGLIKARLDAVDSQATAPAVDQAAVAQALAGQAPDQVAKAQQALTAYAASGAEADLAKIREAFGADRLAAGGLERMYQGSPEALAGLGKAASGAVTIGQLDLAAGGVDVEQLSADLGVDPSQLLAMSPDQFEQAVQDKVNQSLGSVDALRAEYRTASPARQAQILEQLRAADTSGLAATEAAVEHLADALDRAETVQFAGQSFNIQELLKSDRVSDTIRAAASNPEALKQLQATEPGLAAWITQNQAALKQFADSNEAQRTELERTQAKASELTKSLTPELRKALDLAGLPIASGTLTADQVAALEQQLKSNSLYQAIQASPDVRAALQANPELAAKFADMPAAEIAKVAATSKAALADPQLTKLLGLDPAEGMVDPARAAEVAEAAALWDTPAVRRLAASDIVQNGLVSGLDGLKFLAENSKFLAQPDVEDLVQDGTIATPTALRQLAANPKILTELKQTEEERIQLDALLEGNPADHIGSLQQALFGSPLSAAQETEIVAAAKRVKDQGSATGVAGMRARADYQGLLTAYDSDRDGRISAYDFSPNVIAARLRSARDSMPGAEELLQGNGVYLSPLEAARGAVANTAARMGAVGRSLQAEAAKRLAKEEQAKAKAAEDKQFRDDLDAAAAQTLAGAGMTDLFGQKPSESDVKRTKQIALEKRIPFADAWKLMAEERVRRGATYTPTQSVNSTAVIWE